MLIKQNFPIILASSSKIRKKILEEIGLEFTVQAPDVDEDEEKKSVKLSPRKLALFLAEKKALSISRKLKNTYVIGSDQVCEFEDKEFSKSKNSSEAIAQLKKFNGKIHVQNNAVVVTFNDKVIFKNLSAAKLEMRKLSAKEIELYVKTDKSWGCAGSYKYEALGKHLFKKTSGDYYSILGLAIQPLLSFLHDKKIIKFKL